MALFKFCASAWVSYAKVYSTSIVEHQCKPCMQALPLLANHFINTRQLAITSKLNAEVQEKETVLHVTEACVKQLKKVAAPGEFLRLSVEGGGCSGFSYKFDLDTKIQEDDVCFNQDGVQVVSDEISLGFIKGSTVDYEEELIRSAFCVKSNPQSSTKCSCGVSFSID